MKNYINADNSAIQACLARGQKILAQIAAAKDAIQGRFSDLVSDHRRVLNLALNEAEALAWETEHPQLVFQDLAEEKAQGVVNWIAHQRAIRPRM